LALKSENTRLLFGLKLKQLRIDKKLSLTDVSMQSGLSVSYINEIEKGKKYPKPDKIDALAKAMGVSAESLVSQKLSKRLEPITELLDSAILTELPLELFGIDPSTLLQLLSEAPTKTSAFIGTLIEISRNYNMSVEQFYFSALRTYQEMYDNYFEDLEQDAERFLAEKGIPEEHQIDEAYLSSVLIEDYQYRIESLENKGHPELDEVRSLMIPKKGQNLLLLNQKLSSVQRTFILARELGYQFLNLKKRLYTTALVEAESFEQLLNNYFASYFAGAILIKRSLLVKKLKDFFELPTWRPERLLEMVTFFNTTPESFCYRTSNVFPKFFGINQLFFARFNSYHGQNRYDMTKELHLGRKHYPHTKKDEHYCRRWVALTILEDLSEHSDTKGKVLCKAQVSEYADTGEKYLVISFAKNMAPDIKNVSVSMGIYLDESTSQKIRFASDPAFVTQLVNGTCERCSLFSCKVRMAAPVVLQKRNKAELLKKALDKLVAN
jgi:transcriptional regulator with XRE-family HTH domain